MFQSLWTKISREIGCNADLSVRTDSRINKLVVNHEDNYDRKVISGTTTSYLSPLLAHSHAVYLNTRLRSSRDKCSLLRNTLPW